MAERVPRWESELWSYVSSGDGMHCPLYCHCELRRSGGWCADDNRERIAGLLDDEQFESCARLDFTKGGKSSRIFQGRIFRLVEMLAEQFITKGRIRCPPVSTRLVSLADELHTIKVHSLPLKVYHGAVWRLRSKWIIQLKSNDSFAMKRLTLFHEAFHVLAHCRTSPVFKKGGTTAGSFNEVLADFFSACILMPKEWVEEKWAQINDLDQMAKIFDVPKPVMYIRLKCQGLIC